MNYHKKYERLALALCLLFAGMRLVLAHGRLKDPPGRSSTWRAPDVCHQDRRLYDYNDMQLNCGGRTTQWAAPSPSPRGRCGACGDPEGRGDHQPGGRFFTGLISRCYTSQRSAMWIDVNVEITANHEGYMEFKLCQKNNMTAAVTQGCLDQNLLAVRHVSSRSGREQRIWIQQEWSSLDVQLEIPAGIVCSDCVLQWTYFTGNNAGSCMFSTRSQRYECRREFGGPEMFVNCADIAILPNCAALGEPVGRNKKCYNPRLTDGIVILNDATDSSGSSGRETVPDVPAPTPPPRDPTTPAKLPAPVNPNPLPGACENHPNVQCTTTDFWADIPGVNDWCCNNIIDVTDGVIKPDPDRKYHPLICTCSFIG